MAHYVSSMRPFSIYRDGVFTCIRGSPIRMSYVYTTVQRVGASNPRWREGSRQAVQPSRHKRDPRSDNPYDIIPLYCFLGSSALLGQTRRGRTLLLVGGQRSPFPSFHSHPTRKPASMSSSSSGVRTASCRGFVSTLAQTLDANICCCGRPGG